MSRQGAPIMVSAVAFDLDGVIIDSNALIAQVWRTAAERHGSVITDEMITRHVHGRPGSHTVAALFPDHSPERRVRIWREASALEERGPSVAVPGVVELLSRLHRAGVPVALVTSNTVTRIRTVQRALALDAFAAIVSRDDVRRGKPHADPYLVAADRLRTPPAEMLVFEDSDSGITAALRAGAPCVAVNRDETCRLPVVGAVRDFTRFAVDVAPGGGLRLSDLPRDIVIQPGRRITARTEVG